jgi:hypothetical protein
MLEATLCDHVWQLHAGDRASTNKTDTWYDVNIIVSAVQ